MNMSSHLNELRRKHQTLSTKVETAQKSPSADELTIANMKKQKLLLKEQINRLSEA
ncbi:MULTISPECIES: YdcH family protein [Falsihalocynthiibacter]|jgi:hypothetical protein|uniref:YdcH family protein n=1 Tax=Falsihalocynthiibacter TaxID=2854182 RepID=UPI0009EDFD5A|nr:YdcH family protein [Falsihalocynthiibacter arcticus]